MQTLEQMLKDRNDRGVVLLACCSPSPGSCAYPNNEFISAPFGDGAPQIFNILLAREGGKERERERRGGGRRM